MMGLVASVAVGLFLVNAMKQSYWVHRAPT